MTVFMSDDQKVLTHNNIKIVCGAFTRFTKTPKHARARNNRNEKEMNVLPS